MGGLVLGIGPLADHEQVKLVLPLMLAGYLLGLLVGPGCMTAAVPYLAAASCDAERTGHRSHALLSLTPARKPEQGIYYG